MVEEQLPFASEESWRAISETFKNTAHFPNCIGSVDGKNMRILKHPVRKVSMWATVYRLITEMRQNGETETKHFALYRQVGLWNLPRTVFGARRVLKTA